MKWRRTLAWIVGGIAAVILVLIIAAFALLHSHAVQRAILARVLRSASESTGTRISVRSFTVRLSNLSIDLNGITVRGSEPAGAPPLLAADHLGLGIKIVSLVHRTWHLDHVTVDDPVLHVLVNRRGISNIPTPQKKSSGSSTNLFDLSIQRFLLDNGAIYYNNRKSPLDAELHDLLLKAAYDNANDHYRGTLSYDGGLVKFGVYNPIPHGLRAQFDAGRSGMTITPLVLTSGESQFKADVSLENYASPLIRASYDVRVVTGEFRRILKSSSLPSGTIRLAGSMDYKSSRTQPLLESIRLTGDLSSPALAVQTPSVRAVLRDITAHYAVSNGDFLAQGIRARVLGGLFQGNLMVRQVWGSSQQGKLQASLRGMSLADAKAAVPSLRTANVSGTVNADADANWSHSVQNLVARSNVDLHGTVGPAPQRGAAAVPVNAAVHGTYIARGGLITLAQSYVRTPHTSIALNGTVSRRSALQVRASSDDLREIELLAADLNLSSGQTLGLSGSGSFTGAVSGSESNPHVTGQLVATNFTVKGGSWRLLRTNVNLSPASVSLQNGTLQAVPQGRINFEIQAGLHHWSYSRNEQISAKLNASQMKVSDLERLANAQYPITGLLSARVAVHGSMANPAGQGTVDLTHATVAEEPVQSLALRFQGTGTEVNADLTMHLAAGTAQGKLAYFPKDEGYQAELQAHNIQLAQLRSARARNLALKGVLNFNASGRGTVKSPQLQASVTVPQLQVQNQSFRNVSLQAKVADNDATLALNSDVAQTYVRAGGTVGIRSPYNADLKLDTAAIPLQPLVAIYQPAQAGNISGQTELHAWVRGPLKERARLEAHADIPVLNVSYKAIQLAAAAPIHIEYRAGLLSVQPTEIRGTGTDLRFRGAIPVNSRAPASLMLLGTVDLKVVEILAPGLDSSGQLQFDINSQGTAANPSVRGQIRIVNATFIPTGAPMGLEQVNGLFTLSNDRLELTDFQGQLGGGPLTAKGAVTLRPSMQYNLAVAAHGVHFQYPEGVRTGLDTDLTLTGTPEAGWLRGQVRIDRLSFTPDFDLGTFMNQLSAEAPPPPSQGFTNNLRLAVTVQSTSELNLVSSKVSLQGFANLQVRGTAANPVVLGRTTLTGGEVFFLGNRYVIQSGTMDFNNPVRTEPVVNLRLTTLVDQYNITLNVRGPMERLRMSYTSDPTLPPADIIHLLAFGKTTEAAAANPAPGTLGAESVIAQGISSSVASQISKVAGISHLAIDPNLGGTQQGGGPRIAIQQRVTGNLFVTFATDVTSTQREVIELQYNVSPRMSVTAVRDQNGGFGFDARIHKTF